jgi:hypothetical protein
VIESTTQKKIRLAYAHAGVTLWRNNVGACFDERGNFIRYGLANETKQMNDHIKSSDLIGIKPVVITQEMVGQTIGQFIAIETKRSGWVYKGKEREVAQLRFINLVKGLGGEAGFCTGD